MYQLNQGVARQAAGVYTLLRGLCGRRQVNIRRLVFRSRSNHLLASRLLALEPPALHGLLHLRRGEPSPCNTD